MKVIIIGGGIAGLTNALTLQKLGAEAEVYEAVSQFNFPSTGIVLGYNALEILASLGVKDEVIAAGYPVEHIHITNKNLQKLKGDLLNGLIKEYNSPLISIQHSRLIEILKSKLKPGTYFPDKNSTGFLSKKGEISVLFSDGSVVEGKIIIAADGRRSTIRKYIYHDLVFRYPKITSWMGTVKYNLPEKLRNSYVEVWGKGLRFGFVPIDAETVSWYATVHAKPGYKHKTPKHTKQALSLFDKFASPIPEIIRETNPEEISWKDIFDFPPLSHWHRGRICLIGDAAHPLTPGMEQGASMAIEDGFVLGKALVEEEKPKVGYRKFQEQRKAKTDRIIYTAWFAGKIIHSKNPMIQGLGVLGAKVFPRHFFSRYLRKIFSVNYSTKL